MTTGTLAAVLAVAAILLSVPGPGMAAPPDEGFAVYAGGQAVSFDAMVEGLARMDAVFVGENHDHRQGHALELAILQALVGRSPRTALSLEMFERDVQPVVDEYTQGLITEQHFLSSSRPWPNYRTDYAPLVELCKQKGLPVIASNAPRRYVNIVSRKGQAGLDALPKASKAYLPRLPLAMDLPPGYDQELTSIFGPQHAGGPSMPGMPSVENMKEAQALWDVSMADSIARFLKGHRGWRVVHMNGSQHSDHGYGVVDRLRRAMPRLKIAVVSIKPDATWQAAPSEAAQKIADYLVLTPSQLSAEPAAP